MSAVWNAIKKIRSNLSEVELELGVKYPEEPNFPKAHRHFDEAVLGLHELEAAIIEQEANQ